MAKLERHEMDGVLVDLGPGLWPTLAELGSLVGNQSRRKRVQVRRCVVIGESALCFDSPLSDFIAVIGGRGKVLYNSRMSESDIAIANKYF